MSISLHDVRHVANLARLHVSDDRAEAMAAELSKILQHMDVLATVDTEGVEGVVGIGARGMSLRDDTAPRIPMERPLDSIAPSIRGGLLLVPRLDSHGSPSE